MKTQISKLKNILALVVFSFVFLTLNTSVVMAQTINPSVWQNGATGLRTGVNNEKKTAGLAIIVKASGIPFLSLQGGANGVGWGKLYGPLKGIELGEVKIPGTTPALSAESADWSHNRMAFTNNLNIWISRLTPAMLIQNTNAANTLRLFSGNLNGANLVSGNTVGQPWESVVVSDRTPSPAYPKYIAYQSGGAVRVQQIPGSGTRALLLPALDNNWVLVWYGNNSYFTETKAPSSYYDSNNRNILPFAEAYQADTPILLKFENNPTSIIQTSEGGIDLTFGGNSGYTSLMPLYGREHILASETESWGAGGTLPVNVLSKINFWNTNNRLCSYPINVSETYAYDTNNDTSTITENLTYLNVCTGGSAASGFAILPPALSLAKDAFGSNLSTSGTLTDAQYPTEFGPIIGVDNTNTYSWSVSGLRKYTDSTRVITNPSAAPADLVQKLTNEIDRIVQAGHFSPWIYPVHLPLTDYTAVYPYYLNPADIIYQLSETAQALPDSSDPQAPKNRLIDYIKSERTNPNYQPETVYNLPNQGTQRTGYALWNNDPNSTFGGQNNFQAVQGFNPHLFLKRVPLYNFYSLAKYYELPTTGAVPTTVVNEARNALNRDMAEQDWATSSWFRGFDVGVVSGHSTLINVNRLLDGLIGFVKLAKSTNDSDENLGRALLAKAAVQRIAMTKYPRYLYSANLQNLPPDPDWMPKYEAGFWHGWIWNYNWKGAYDDPRQIAWQDQFGTALADSTSFYPPMPLEIRDYEYLVDAQLSAYNDMVPETLRLVTDYAKQDLEIMLNRFTNLAPHWYMPYMDDIIGGEHGTTYPINSYQLFMAKAFVQNDTPQNLRKYASFSWLDSGDFFYMQKLAETIKAYQGWAWEDELVSPTPSPTPVPCTISSVSWPQSMTTITEGSNVNISVTASGSCSSKQVHLTVRRNVALQPDVDAINQPTPRDVTLTLTGNTATGSATWRSDNWSNACTLTTCNPTFFVRGNIVGETAEVTTDRNNDLIVTQSQVIPTDPNDWPQVQKDPQRTGYSNETLGNNFRVAWSRAFQPERIHPQVQAIVAAGKVYVGTEVGNVYAVTAGASGGQVAWKFTAGGPIVSSAAFYNNRVYFGSLDGAIYALDADTGAQVWKNQASKLGFSTAVTIADNKILLGGRDGYFYALNPNDGSVIWKYDVGAPIFMTAAFNQGKVFFGAMNMFVYGLNTSPSNPNDSNTILAWKSAKIPAGAFKDFWPVVTQGKVFIIPNAKAPNPGIDPGYPFVWGPDWTWLSQNSTTIATGGAYLVPDIVNSQNTAITNYRTNPSRYNKNMYILDENTGQEAQVVPHWSTQTHSGTTTPPCVDREGKLVVPIMFMASGWGRLDINLGRITDILYDGYDIGGNLITSASRSNPMGFGNVDENYALSCTNNYILARHVNETTVGAGSTGVFNLDLRKWTIIGNEWTTPKQMQHNTQGGGTNAFTVSNGMIYDIVFHTLQARTTN